jgi:hypothetical protein
MARQRLKKFAFWTCIAIPVLVAMYFGAYYRMVTPVRLISVSGTSPVPVLHSEPRYYLPWPVPVHYSHSQLQPQLVTAFTPAHQFDRWVRPQLWIEQKVSIQMSSTPGGAATLIMAQ